MIVIVIMGVVYTLAVGKLQTFGEQKAEPTLGNLKEYLLSFTKDAKNARLLCLDECRDCDIYVDDVKTATIEDFLESEVEVYRYDFLQGPILKKEDVFFNEEDVQERVCFSFSVSRNMVADQVIVVYKNKAYDYTTYFTPTRVYDSLEEAVDVKENEIQEAMQ